jgi:hypothetical protein
MSRNTTLQMKVRLIAVCIAFAYEAWRVRRDCRGMTDDA